MSVVTVGVWSTVTGREAGLGAFVAAQVGLWAGFVGIPLLVTRVKGAGSMAHDFGWRFSLRDAVIGIPLGVGCQLLLVPALFALMSVFVSVDSASGPAARISDLADTWASGALLVLSVVVGAPLAEELYFRGLLLRGLEARRGTVIAVVGSSIVFGASHFQPLQFVPLAAFGAVLAVATVRTGRLGLAAWTHMAFNATTLVVLGVS